MTGGSIARAAIAAALASAATMPALAQDGPPPAQSGQSSDEDGGFASRDASPPDGTAAASPGNEDDDGGTRRSTPQPSDDPAAGDETSLDADPHAAAGTINSFSQPDPAPGFQATSGIDNRNQAVSSCLAAVRDRVGGGAGAARVDGIRGEWMVSGAVTDGRAFYCSIHAGAIADIELGS